MESCHTLSKDYPCAHPHPRWNWRDSWPSPPGSHWSRPARASLFCWSSDIHVIINHEQFALEQFVFTLKFRYNPTYSTKFFKIYTNNGVLPLLLGPADKCQQVYWHTESCALGRFQREDPKSHKCFLSLL